MAKLPAPVEDITAAHEDATVTVEWTPVTGASKYRVYYSSQSILQNGGVYDDFEETKGKATTHTLEPEFKSTKVYVTVLAVNSAGEESPVFREETFVILSQSSLKEDSVSMGNFTFKKPEKEPNEAPKTIAEPKKELFTVSKLSTKRDEEVVVEELENVEVVEIPEQGEGVIPTLGETDDGGKLHLLLAESKAPTEVLLTFSTFPMVDPTQAPQAFRIVDADGKVLNITSLYLKEEFISVQTEPQVRGAQYHVKLSEPLGGQNGFPLDAFNRTAVFRGHEEGIEKVPDPEIVQQVEEVPVPIQAVQEVVVVPEEPEPSFPAAPEPPPQPVCNPQSIIRPPSITGLRLRSTEQEDGTYNVSVRWDINTQHCEELLKYIVRQSSDRGRSFTQAQIINADISGIDIPGVRPGEYGLGIAVMNSLGYATQEVFENITLPGAAGIAPILPAQIIHPAPMAPAAHIPAKPAPKPVVQQPVVQPPVPQPILSAPRIPLPETGMGLAIGGILAIGSAIGMRRKPKSHSQQ